MEKNLLKIFKLADELNEKQDKVYAEIKYSADDQKTLTISIRTKNDFTYIENCEVSLFDKSLFRWKNIIEVFENYVGGIDNE